MNLPQTVELDKGSVSNDSTNNTDQSDSSAQNKKRYFIYRAQLTLGLGPSPSVSVPALFTKWLTNSAKHIPDFSLLPYNDEKGQQITASEQIPDNKPSFYSTYYHNHWVLNHGNLTGMVHFQCSITWSKIKHMKGDYFQWLHWNKVFLNQTRFKIDTLVTCGLLAGAHPGHLRRDEAEREIHSWLQLDDHISFPLSFRTVSVFIEPGKDQKYSFQAIAVDTAVTHSRHIQEAFFSLPKPAVAQQLYPYPGPYQFVPLLVSKEWSTQKIFQLAKVHVRICQNLKVIYIENLWDVHNVISEDGHTLL